MGWIVPTSAFITDDVEKILDSSIEGVSKGVEARFIVEAGFVTKPDELDVLEDKNLRLFIDDRLVEDEEVNKLLAIVGSACALHVDFRESMVFHAFLMVGSRNWIADDVEGEKP